MGLALPEQTPTSFEDCRRNFEQIAGSRLGGLGELFFFGSGSPEGVVTATRGLYIDSSGGAGSTLWVKESGTGNTGWVAK